MLFYNGGKNGKKKDKEKNSKKKYEEKKIDIKRGGITLCYACTSLNLNNI